MYLFYGLVFSQKFFFWNYKARDDSVSFQVPRVPVRGKPSHAGSQMLRGKAASARPGVEDVFLAGKYTTYVLSQPR